VWGGVRFREGEDPSAVMDEALDHLRKARDAWKERGGEAWVALGICGVARAKWAVGDRGSALAEARDCLQKAAGEPEAYRWLGYLEAEEGNWNSALDAFRTARDKGARNKRELERWMRKVEGKIR